MNVSAKHKFERIRSGTDPIERREKIPGVGVELDETARRLGDLREMREE